MISPAATLATVITVVTGGVAVLPLPEDVISARYRDEQPLVVAGHAIIGIPADAEPGPRRMAVRTASGAAGVDFLVVAKEYPEQRLNIANPRLVNPLAEDLRRIRREAVIQRAAYALRTAPRRRLAPFTRPVAGVVSSPFGLRRILNGEPRARHSGLDIAADSGTPVRAPAPATVAVIGDFFFNGNTVLLDHGGGLVTMYCHLHRIDVGDGQEVARGDTIGAVGASGRATGPHLHWTVSVQEVRVDPEQVLAAFSALAGGETLGGGE